MAVGIAQNGYLYFARRGEIEIHIKWSSTLLPQASRAYCGKRKPAGESEYNRPACILFAMEHYMARFNGLGMHLGNLARLSAAKTRSISPENFTGEKGQGGMATDGTGAPAARDLGQGWKLSPSIRIAAGETRELAAIDGSGA